MSTGLPFPVSDNRSYANVHTSPLQANPLYSHDHEYLQYRGAALKFCEYRSYSGVASGSRSDPQLHAVPVSGHFDHYPEYPSRFHTTAEGYDQTNIANSHYSPIDPQNLLQTAEDSTYGVSVFRDPHLSGDTPTPSPSTSPHSPNISFDHLPRPAGGSPTPPQPRYTSKRREKPHIELAPDQPLTTQGKPRTRVYVACVQCRSRKIRCDGAKPVCHNCSRRTSSTNAGGIPECTYDTAPKRRGPDRNPGARQRMALSEDTDGGKVRKRRRRNPEASKQVLDINVNALTNVVAGIGSDQKPMRIHNNAGIPSAAQSHVSARPQGLTLVVEDLDAYRSREHDPAFLTNVDGASNHTSPVQHVPHISDIQQRDAIAISSHSSQDVLHLAPPATFYPYRSPVSEIGFDTYTHASKEYINSSSEEYDENIERKPEIGAEPSLQFTRDTWWDALLSLYCSRTHPQHLPSSQLTQPLREAASQQVSSEIRFLFRASNYWFSFFNISRFYTRLLDPIKRNGLQPSLVLASLAVATFIQSSEQEGGSRGRTWALRLRDEAQSALEASLSSRRIDESLVHASWLIAFFEISAHPEHSTARVRSAMAMLDSLIRCLSLTKLDQDDPRVSTFAPCVVPSVPSSHTHSQHDQWNPVLPLQRQGADIRPDTPTSPCSCSSFTLGHNSSLAQEVTPLWLTTPAWQENSSESEIRKEECRRVVWSSLMLAAGHSSYTAACSGFSQMELYIHDHSNYAVLFPGESISPASASKDTVWALYMRTMLLWHSCIRMRLNVDVTEAEKAQFAVGAWLEVDKIEDALSKHTCNIERAYLFQGREYLFNARMCISYEFQRYIPQATANANLLFHRKKAEEWLTHQASVAKQAMYGLQNITGQPNVSMGRRSFFVFWFMSQISRALTLWTCDHSLTVALDMSKTLLAPIEYLMSLWPCPEQRRRYKELRESLMNACYAAGVPAPISTATMAFPARATML